MDVPTKPTTKVWQRACMIGLGGTWFVAALLFGMALNITPFDPPSLIVAGLLLLVCGGITFWPEIRRD